MTGRIGRRPALAVAADPSAARVSLQVATRPAVAGRATPLQPPDAPQPSRPGERQPLAIWDGETQSFSPGVLRRAMLVRGFTPDSLAVAAGVGHGTVYNALSGQASRLTTGRRLLQTLAAVEPSIPLSRLSSPDG